jgi:hypothetical protein
MSGQPTTRTYLERIEQADIGSILDQIAEGYRISEIAPQLGVSRGFLSTHLNATALGRECLAVARETAQRGRKHGRTSRLCAPLADAKHDQFQGWLTAHLSPTRQVAPIAEAGTAACLLADHLAALQQMRVERAAPPQQQPTPPAPA